MTAYPADRAALITSAVALRPARTPLATPGRINSRVIAVRGAPRSLPLPSGDARNDHPAPATRAAPRTAVATAFATGRSDYPNQINNVLAFPGIFRGLLDAQARDITDAMLLAASTAIADVVNEPNPSFIVPSVFDPAVAKAVATAVRGAARVAGAG